MSDPELDDRFESLRMSYPNVRRYVLLDGWQYCSRRSTDTTGLVPFSQSLFAGTVDEALSNAGPWLVDLAAASKPFVEDMMTLEREGPVLVGLFAQTEPGRLKVVLQHLLNAESPDAEALLLRFFWDPRVLPGLLAVLTTAQRAGFFAEGIRAWHLLQDGKRVWIGGNHVEVH